MTRETAGWGDVADQVTALAAPQAVQDLHDDRPDRVLVGGDPLGREAPLEECLHAVVLGRVHPDEHRLGQLEREFAQRHEDASEF